MKCNKKDMYNTKSRLELEDRLESELFDRITTSFYKYTELINPEEVRDKLYLKFRNLKVLGRIYISGEGINAQVSVPEHNFDKLLSSVEEYFGDTKLKKAIQEGTSFFKLTIKVRKELVAYGFSKDTYNKDQVGKHLDAEAYNKAISDPNSVLIDMRNYYESEIGKFENAITPNVETSKELLPKVKKILAGKEDKQILLYCTGGIRCEKASTYLIKNGFKNVNQLEGGIIQYANDIKKKNIKSKFIGKNFVFDNRLGERITDDIISNCHICKEPCDNHRDCKNDGCNILFIQCNSCYKVLNGCCSRDCQNFIKLPFKKRKIYRKDHSKIVSKIFLDSRVKSKVV
tara:strand:+ start:1037 stop:2068 length:1032 start_codon:yes stop_codon:yes gene_type:complete